ncbi:MAG TPA: hypothetical protein VFX70_12025 [Mycobacteriales bacterium]|nr:hypothetical protein [Mycobacteriales bacterium]
MTGTGVLHLTGPTHLADLGTFLGRATRIDPGGLVRLRADQHGRTIAAYTRLPFGVLVGRTVPGTLSGVSGAVDVTVGAADLAAGIAADLAGGATRGLALPGRRDAQWRGSLPPAGGWRRLDLVPVASLRRVVAAGVRAFEAAQRRAADPRAAQGAANALLDQGALTVSDDRDTAVLALRVCHAAWRMGFLGEDDGVDCSVSVSGRWARLAAPFGSAYRDPAGVSLLAP